MGGTVAPAARGVSDLAWLDELAHAETLVEVVDGEFVVKRVGGNPHHDLARRFAAEFEQRWRGVVATAPGNCTLATTTDQLVLRGRMPDVRQRMNRMPATSVPPITTM